MTTKHDEQQTGVVNARLRMTIEGMTPYSSSRLLDDEKKKRLSKQGEKPGDFDNRVWREKATANDDGMWIIPARAFHWAFMSAAKKLGHKIPGRGQVQYTQFVEAGMHFIDGLSLGVRVTDLDEAKHSIYLPCDAQGRKGRAASTRVFRRFPHITTWGGVVEAYVFSGELLHTGYLREVADTAGLLVGVGRWRPEMGGQNGRFTVTKFELQ